MQYFSFHRSLLCRLLALSALLLTPAVIASTPQPTLMFAFSELAPWKIRDGGKPAGAYTEIVRELARRIGYRLEIAECPHKRCLLMMESGAADVAIGLQQSPERDVFMHYLQTPYRKTASDRVFYVRRGDAARIKRYEDLYGKEIGVTEGSGYFDRFDEDALLIKASSRNAETNLRKLVLKRLDAVVIPEDQGAVWVSELSLGSRVERAQFRVPDPTPRSLAVSRRSPLMGQLNKLEAAMQAMRRDGTLAAIYQRHYYQRYGISREQARVE